MKKSELIKTLEEIEGDFDIRIKVPSDYSFEADHVTVNESNETITLYSL